ALDAQVSSEKVQLRYYDIAAPAAGVIGDIPVRDGDYVTSATRLTTIDQNTALEAYFNVPIERAVELRPGLPVELLDEAGKVVADGQVDFIAPRVSDTTQSLVVKAPIANVHGGMRAAQFMPARLMWSSRQSPVVPTTAVTRLGGQPFVFVADAEGKNIVAHQKNVELGELSGDVYEIRSGVSAGDRVVVSGVQKLRDGAPIVPEPQAAPAEKR
ncbi:MAG TPA: efflux RND transporter periplasmic adaptor subunit, partial [Vicinamibacterales bacterium]|nr:efflux RND transporter periplasmic adaptor subunit [Vicinamibacterales bacterium]